MQNYWLLGPSPASQKATNENILFIAFSSFFSPNAALYELSGHTDKALCCDWSGRLLLSGGADNTLRIYKAKVPTTS